MTKNAETQAAYRAKHREAFNAKQKARYHAQKAAGTLPPSQTAEGQRQRRLRRRGRALGPVTGTMTGTVFCDALTTVNPSLRLELLLFALLKRDAKIWRQRMEPVPWGTSATTTTTPVALAAVTTYVPHKARRSLSQMRKR